MKSGIKNQKKGFVCLSCQQWIPVGRGMGTHYRNHCPSCLYSRHVDEKNSGDRSAGCHGKMEPIGLTFKREGWDKYGIIRQGELMIIHRCLDCNEVSINRIAADDKTKKILEIFEESKKLDQKIKDLLTESEIRLLEEKDLQEIKNQLFGKGKTS